jgi:outer membrane protein
MKYIQIILFIAFSAINLNTYAQQYSLKHCIEIAVENNLQVQKGRIDEKISEVNLKQSKDYKLPSLAAVTGQGFSLGRGVDPYTNSIINQKIAFNNVGLSGGVTLFSGWQQKNTVKQNEYLLRADQASIQSDKENITLNVILAYLEILNKQEQLTQTNNQAEITKTQISKTERLVTAGIVPATNLIDLKLQLANDDLDRVNAKNDLADAKLNLLQLMNLPINTPIEVEPIEANNINIQKVLTENIYLQAIENKSIIKGYQYRLLAADAGIEIAKSIKYPIISLNSGIYTNYSSAAKRSISSGEVLEENTGLYVPTQSGNLPVMISQQKTSVERLGYFNQMSLNRNFSFNLQLKIPLFHGHNLQNKLNLARLNKENLLVNEKMYRQTLRQNIEFANNKMVAAFERYTSIQKQLSASNEAFVAAEVKFNAGTINSMDFNLSKTNLDKAKLNLIQAKYDYLLRVRILEFYEFSE